MCCALGQKSRCSWISRTAGGQPCCWKIPYQRFIRFSAKREELAVRLKRLSGQPDGRPPILGIRFDAGEITLSGTAEDIPHLRPEDSAGPPSERRLGRRHRTGVGGEQPEPAKRPRGLSIPCIFPGTADYSVLKPIWQIPKPPSDGSVKAYEPDNHHSRLMELLRNTEDESGRFADPTAGLSVGARYLFDNVLIPLMNGAEVNTGSLDDGPV